LTDLLSAFETMAAVSRDAIENPDRWDLVPSRAARTQSSAKQGWGPFGRTASLRRLRSINYVPEEKLMNDYEAFGVRLGELFHGDRYARAAELARRFWTEPFTGRYFHVLADRDRPNEITEIDIVAVSMLGVTIPAPVAVSLLTGDERGAVGELLAQIPLDADIWDAEDRLEQGEPLWSLWDLLNRISWPTSTLANDMGQTKISKLLATKRPRLVPVFDSVVAKLFPAVDNYWAAFAHALADVNDRLTLSIVCGGEYVPEEAGFLRRLDAVLWMIGHEPDW
jgi:hypothetical protein